MTYTPKPGQGTLWPNEQRSSAASPDMTGTILAHRDIKAGEKLSLAAWKKDAGRGEFLSLRMSDPRGRADGNKPPSDDRSALPDPEIPF